MTLQCDANLRDQIHERLSNFDVQLAEDNSLREAGVAVLITDVGMGPDLPGIENPTAWSNEACLLLTRRSEKLRNHPGQWSFPGGRRDAGETLEETALRELSEEVGIQLGKEAILGRLDDFVTRSGFAMSPYVIWAGPDVQAVANPDEVASIHRIPMAEFLRADAPLLDANETSDHPILRMPVGSDYIAAPTAALIYQFAQVCLLGRSTRVAHFEQPAFAWN